MYNNHNPMIRKETVESKYVAKEKEYDHQDLNRFFEGVTREETILDSHLNLLIRVNERIHRVSNDLNEVGYKLNSEPVDYPVGDFKEPSKNFSELLHYELLRLVVNVDMLENIKNKFKRVI